MKVSASGKYEPIGVAIPLKNKRFIFKPIIDSVWREDLECVWELFKKKKPSAFRSKLIAKYTDDMLSPEFDSIEKMWKWVDKYEDDILKAIKKVERGHTCD